MSQKKNISLPKERVKFLSEFKSEISEQNDLKIVSPEVSRYFEGMLNVMIHADTGEKAGEKERVGLDEAVKNLGNVVVITEEPVFLETKESIEEFQSRWTREGEEALLHTPSYKRAQEIKHELHWMDLANSTVGDAIGQWLDKISNPRTKRTYGMAMQALCKEKLINLNMSLQVFSMRNHDVTVDEIKAGKLFYKKETKCKNTGKLMEELVPWSEATRQQRAACFIAFTGDLSRKHGGIIRKAMPERLSKDKTFHRINAEVKTPAFQNRKESKKFLDQLHELNPRDCLIAKMMLQGGRRICEVLSVEIHMIDYAKKEITFKQSKTKGEVKERIATYTQEFMDELKEYIGERQGLVFISSKGTPLFPQHIERNFKKAGERAGIHFKVRPHVMRATAVTQYKMNGCSDSDIHKLTGQSTEMIRMYDKTDKAENASKIVSLI